MVLWYQLLNSNPSVCRRTDLKPWLISKLVAQPAKLLYINPGAWHVSAVLKCHPAQMLHMGHKCSHTPLCVSVLNMGSIHTYVLANSVHFEICSQSPTVKLMCIKRLCHFKHTHTQTCSIDCAVSVCFQTADTSPLKQTCQAWTGVDLVKKRLITKRHTPNV